MAGFSENLVYEKLNVNKDDYNPMAAIAIGYSGDKSTLPADFAAMEKPGERKPLSQIILEGKAR